MRFNEIRGQDGPVSILIKSLEKGRVPAAYLFTGPPGCGRMMAALATAAALNCQSGPTACGACSSCLLYASGNHPDLHVTGVEDSKRQITIEQIRERVLERAYLKPMIGNSSTFIIEDANRMNLNASNAFLKTLEEPPLTSHFILIVPDRDSVLPTISSRCQPLAFSPLPRQLVEDILIKKGIGRDEASLLAAMARGSVKKALDYHANDSLEELSQEFEPLSSMHRYGTGQLLDLAQKWGRNRQDALDILEIMAQWYRDMMIMFEGAPEDEVIHLAHRDELKKDIDKIGGKNLSYIIESVEDAREAIEANTNVQLTLDTLLLRIREYATPEGKSI